LKEKFVICCFPTLIHQTSFCWRTIRFVSSLYCSLGRNFHISLVANRRQMKNCSLRRPFPARELIRLSASARLTEAPLSIAPGRVLPGEVLGEELPHSFLLSLFPRTATLVHLCRIRARPLQVTIRLNRVLFPLYSILCDARSHLHCFVLFSQMFACNSEVQQLILWLKTSDSY